MMIVTSFNKIRATLYSALLFSLSILHGEPVARFEDVRLPRFLYSLGEVYDVDFVMDTGMKIPRLSYSFELSQPLAVTLVELQAILLKDGVIFLHVKEREIVLVAQFKDKRLLEMIVGDREEGIRYSPDENEREPENGIGESSVENLFEGVDDRDL